MTAGGLYSVVMALLLAVLVGAGLMLARYRDRLTRAFGPAQTGLRAAIDVAPGTRIAVVEIDGVRVVAAIGKAGITAMQVVPLPASEVCDA